jgi:hypothetical protein
LALVTSGLEISIAFCIYRLLNGIRSNFIWQTFKNLFQIFMVGFVLAPAIERQLKIFRELFIHF